MRNIIEYQKSTLQWSLILILLFSITIFSCKKLVEIDAPTTSINGESVYTSDATAISVITGIYTSLSQGRFVTGSSSITVDAGLSADELTLYNGVSSSNLNAYYSNSLSSNTFGFEFWNQGYSFIFTCNSAIEGISKSTALTPNIKTQLLGEAKFMRAFFYFYLTNLYGDVPLVLTTDYKTNNGLARSAKEDVYKQIIADLIEAKSLLNGDYLDGSLMNITSSRIRPNKSTASALLSRCYLYIGSYAEAESEATSVIDNPKYSLDSLTNVFLNSNLGNKEPIWQLQPVNTGWNTEDARIFVLNAPLGNDKPVYLSESLLSSFELGDRRRSSWVMDTTIGGKKYSFAYKYRQATLNNPVTEYLNVFRLAELQLIRAEARTEKGDFNGAWSDLNLIRTRAGLPNVFPNDKSSLISIILHERQIELFLELGHRWIDLKRRGNVDSVMKNVTLQKGGTWQSSDQLYPIYSGEIQKNPKLVQNPGY